MLQGNRYKMNGLDMLLKATGFDVAEFQGFISGIKAYMAELSEGIETLKQQQQILLDKLESIENATRKD